MDIDVARHVLRAAFRAARELQELLPVLRASCRPDEYDAYARGIGSAVAEIALEVTNRTIAAQPELETEVEADMTAYGTYL